LTEAAAKQFTPENKPRLQAVRAAFAALDTFDVANVEAALRKVAAGLGVKLGALVHPTRLAVTGATAGPSLYHLLEVLGRDKVLARLDRALQKIL
jgi:glutamyl-tRNA synthetase